MDFDWDSDKAASNVEKHAVTFADAATVFDDPGAATTEDEDAEEQRFVAIGSTSFGQLLVVVYTYRGDTIRIISARKATKSERREYEEL